MSQQRFYESHDVVFFRFGGNRVFAAMSMKIVVCPVEELDIGF